MSLTQTAIWRTLNLVLLTHKLVGEKSGKDSGMNTTVKDDAGYTQGLWKCTIGNRRY